MKLNLFESGWRKVKQDSTVWGSLLLFVLGIAMLLMLMKLLPYST